MEILGLSHPAVSTTASISQRLQDLAREARDQGTATTVQAAAAQTTSVAAPDATNFAPSATVTPSQPTSESLLEARAPVEPSVQRSARDEEIETGAITGRVPDADETKYEFPEELPMSLEELMDMLQTPPDSSASGGNSYSDILAVTEPAEAEEAVRFNRTA